MNDYFGKRYFSAQTAGNGVALTNRPAGGHEDVSAMRLIASSKNVRVNCEQGRPFTVLHISASGPGIVCVAFYVTTNHNRGKGGQSSESDSMILGVDLVDGQTVVDLDNPWAPPGSLSFRGYLDPYISGLAGEIAVRGKINTYTNNPVDLDNRPNTFLVPDPNLLASFLAGDDHVYENDLRLSSTAHTEEVRAREEMPKILQQLEEMRQLDKTKSDLIYNIRRAIGEALNEDLQRLGTGSAEELFAQYREQAMNQVRSRNEIIKILGDYIFQLRVAAGQFWFNRPVGLKELIRQLIVFTENRQIIHRIPKSS